VRIGGVERVGQIEDVLVKEGHFDIGVRIVEVDGGLQCAASHGDAYAGGKVSCHVVLEVVEQNSKLAVRRGEGESRLIQVDDSRAGIGERLEGGLDRRRHRRRGGDVGEAAEAHAGDSDASAAEAVRVQKLGVIGRDV